MLLIDNILTIKYNYKLFLSTYLRVKL